MMSVEDYDLGAVLAACKAFIRGDVKGRNHSFAPSAPELATECQNQQDRLRWRDHVERHEFIAVDSDDWRRVTQLRGNTPPMMTNSDGKLGWYVPKIEMAEARKLQLPAPISEEKRKAIGRDLKRLAAGDSDDGGDWGQRGAA